MSIREIRCNIIALTLATASALTFAADAERECVAFVCAHPDDLAGCSGAAFLLAERFDVRVIDFTRGEYGLGEAGYRDGSCAKMRMAEERAACAMLGTEPYFLCEFKDCWFGNTHLALQTDNQLKSVEIVRKVVAERSATKPVFLVGDWNEEPTSRTLAAMRGFMTILSNEKSRTHHGFKSFKPGSEYCIDYIAVDSAHAGNFAVCDAYVVPDFTTSDHCPVFVTVTRKE